MKKVFVFGGTGERFPGATTVPEGTMLWNVTKDLNPAEMQCEWVDYPAQFGPAGGDVMGVSMEQSVAQAKASGIAKINAYSGKFALLGYSQGALVSSEIGYEILNGSLQHRKNDCVFVGNFASGYRNKGQTFHNGNTLSGEGLLGSGGSTYPIDWFDYTLPGDMYGDTIWADSYLDEVAKFATGMTFSDPVSWGFSVLRQLNDATWLTENIDELVTNPVRAARKLANTIAAVIYFFTSNVHVKYAEWDIIPGWTATRHCANHMNYWLPQR